MRRFLFGQLIVPAFIFSLGAGGILARTEAFAMDVETAGRHAEAAPLSTNDVIAKVGDQSIRFSQLTKELDQGAVVGVSVPGYGTPERKQILMRLLDDAIRNRLLYLDALRQGVDRDPAYQRELERFKDGLLASLFRERHAQNGQQVPDDQLRKQWRQGIAITIDEGALDPARDDERSNDEVLATVGSSSITWGDAKTRLLTATRRGALSQREGATDARTGRRWVLDQLIDVKVMAQRAREAGLEQAPEYRQRLAKHQQTGLAGFHYRQLVSEQAPTAEEIGIYAKEHGKELRELNQYERRAMEGMLVRKKIEQYLDDLESEGIQITVDEDKLDQLFAREAE